MSIDVSIEAHEQATRLDIHELVRRLNVHLGPTVVAMLANANDRKLPHRWAKADGPEPRDESQVRLRDAHRVWTMISAAENDNIARAWFIGANPRLDEESPAMALRLDKRREVIAAAKAFIEGTDD